MPTWTLSALVVCYALFPAAWRLATRVRSPWIALAAGVGLYLLIDVAALSVTGVHGFQLPLRYGLVRGIPLFMIGLLIARLGETIRVPDRMADTLALGAVVSVVALQVLGRFDHLSLALLGLLIFAAGATAPKGWVWAGAAGRLSFSLFLTNQFVAVVWFGAQRAAAAKFGFDPTLMWLTWALALPACVAFAWMFERLVDAPLQVWIKGWSRRERTTSMVSAQAGT